MAKYSKRQAKGSRRYTAAERAAYWKKLYFELRKSRSK